MSCRLLSKMSLSFVGSLFAWGAAAQNTFQIVEVELANAFVAPEGFDSNDDVLVVVEGWFPNGCYFKGNTDVHKDYSAHKVVIRQFAKIEKEGVCADFAKLPPELAAPKRFEAELYLGTLAPYKTYSIEYTGAGGVTLVKNFEVVKAPVDHVDNLRYAILENAFVKNKVSTENKKMEIRLTGYLNSSCSEIAEDPKPLVYKDVIVVLLEVVNTGSICIPMNKSFYKVIEADVPPEGRYLLHARSQGGQAKNKIFSVVKPEDLDAQNK
jgi:hypothetical protein